MLELNKPSPINQAKVWKIIIEPEQANADIEYDVGYLDDKGDFVSIGVDHFHIEDKKQEKDKQGKITQEKKTDYTDFKAAFSTAKDPVKLAEDMLLAKAIIKAKVVIPK